MPICWSLDRLQLARVFFVCGGTVHDNVHCQLSYIDLGQPLQVHVAQNLLDDLTLRPNPVANVLAMLVLVELSAIVALPPLPLGSVRYRPVQEYSVFTRTVVKVSVTFITHIESWARRLSLSVSTLAVGIRRRELSTASTLRAHSFEESC